MLYEDMADDDWFDRLKQEVVLDGRSYKVISLAAGLGQNYLQQMMTKGQPPKAATLNALLAILGPEAERRVRGQAAIPSEVREANIPVPLGMQRDVPVYGTVAGSDLNKGAFQLTPEIVDYVRRPPGLLTAKDIYALYVEGTSMVPRFEPGELIYVNPNRPPRPGDYVVIQETDPKHEIRGFVKQLVRVAGGAIVVRQLNPEGELRFKTGAKVHKVLTIADLMGI